MKTPEQMALEHEQWLASQANEKQAAPPQSDAPQVASAEHGEQPAPRVAPPSAPPPAQQTTKGQVVVKAGAEIRPLVPTTIQELFLFCKNMAQSYSLPEHYYKKPKLPDGQPLEFNIMEVATARAMQSVQLGMEVGLPPAQSLQSIVMLNGVGTIWGDAQLGLVQRSGLLEALSETDNGEDIYLRDQDGNPQRGSSGVKTGNRKYVATCSVTRGGVTTTQSFGVQDAIDAGLWGKSGTWSSHPARMCRYKARAFALRDRFADVLKGLAHSVEEMEGEIIDVTPTQKEGASLSPVNGASKLIDVLSNSGISSSDSKEAV
jgi:hypothetical protein